MERFFDAGLVKPISPRSEVLNVDDLTLPLVISYDNDSTNIYAQNLIKSLQLNKWEYIMIGEGIKWSGLECKSRGYAKALSLLNPKKMVVLIDSRDVVCLRSPSFFMESFNMVSKLPIIVSMELFCDGKTTVDDSYIGGQCVSLTKYWNFHKITSPPTRKFVNSGLIAGFSGAIRDVFGFIVEKSIINDQLGVGIYMNENPDKIFSDSDATLLHSSTFGVNACLQDLINQSKDAPSFAEILGRGAYFLHLPGAGISKGQMYVYSNVTNLICEKMLCDAAFRSGYTYPEPGLYGYKF